MKHNDNNMDIANDIEFLVIFRGFLLNCNKVE